MPTVQQWEMTLLVIAPISDCLLPQLIMRTMKSADIYLRVQCPLCCSEMIDPAGHSPYTYLRVQCPLCSSGMTLLVIAPIDIYLRVQCPLCSSGMTLLVIAPVST